MTVGRGQGGCAWSMGHNCYVTMMHDTALPMLGKYPTAPLTSSHSIREFAPSVASSSKTHSLFVFLFSLAVFVFPLFLLLKNVQGEEKPFSIPPPSQSTHTL